MKAYETIKEDGTVVTSSYEREWSTEIEVEDDSEYNKFVNMVKWNKE